AVTISASTNNVCEGDTIVFTATPVNGGNVPAYEWEVNGVKEGPDSPIYATNNLAPGDTVNCQLLSSEVCAQPVLAVAISPLIRPLPPITIQAADTVIPYGQEVQLQAIADTSVTNYQWTPAATLNNPSIADPVASPIANTLYQVSVLGSNGCSAKATIEIKVYKALKMPNAFTPNSDGRNDVFQVPPSLQITVINFSVYNRWGERVFFASGSTQGWDGRLNNHPQPAGVYVWQLKYLDELTGQPAYASGTVMLIR
ncbi:MAG TPA: gliding motility-associated C-terminal domain-containing protein, partial [Puia sp.]|nr:gliding motility-associated C-terminal domain-containing protein [Puia sp.]